MAPDDRPDRPSCPVCSSGRFDVDCAIGDLTVGHCAECGLAYTDPLEAAEHATVGHADSALTDPGYIANRKARFEVDLREAARAAARRLDAYEGWLGSRPGSLLEVGCGAGTLGVAFTRAGVEWHGVELDGESAAFARQQGVDATTGDFLALGDRPPVDVVTASQVLEHVLDPRSFVKGAIERVRPGGLVHLDVPNHAGLPSRLRRLPRLSGNRYGFVQPPYHLIAYSPRSLRRLLEDAGLEVLFMRGVANTDRTWGQPVVSVTTPSQRAFMTATGWARAGSILAAVARAPSP